MVTEYVKPDATLEKKVADPIPEGKVIFEGKVDGWELTSEKEAEIIALPEITEATTKKVMRCSSKRALVILEALRAEGKLKTKAERYAELFPSKEIEEPAVVEK